MTNSLDDIFSPERLRHSWQQDEIAAERKDERAAEPHETETPLAVFQRLRGRIQERFPGEQGEPLAVLLNEVEEKLLRRFPQTDDTVVSEEEKSALNQAIETLLNDIEDLAEALELQRRSAGASP
jgi:hypothetical protein